MTTHTNRAQENTTMNNGKDKVESTIDLWSFFFELPSKVLPKLPSFNVWPFTETQHKKTPFQISFLFSQALLHDFFWTQHKYFVSFNL